jgi:cellobiose phosphorylase
MQVTIENTGHENLKMDCAAVIPIFGRSADNIRDHRHVTSLLQRAFIEPYGIRIKPTLTFDERGHHPAEVNYRVWAAGDKGESPSYVIPRVSDFIGAGNYDWPQAVVCPDISDGRLRAGESAEGGEMNAALFFTGIVLPPGAKKSFRVVLAIEDDPTPYLTPEGTAQALKRTKEFWKRRTEDCFAASDRKFTFWMRWVSAQPLMRRICGCSFLPHHDYGRGGRGWRDLWQDSLALLLDDSSAMRQSLLSYFAGVRPDGTNATIIGDKPGEFKSDRNHIPRVWMDHAFWPSFTAALYFDETGDSSLFWENQTYFRDGFSIRGDGEKPADPGKTEEGTVLEHLILENVTSFFDVGEHGNMRLHGADWNDGLDMASHRGESVAFTAAYAWSLDKLSEILQEAFRRGIEKTEILKSLAELMNFSQEEYGNPTAMREALTDFCRKAYAEGEKSRVSLQLLSERLHGMAEWICVRIRQDEWTGDQANQNWFNSYYDDHGRQSDGLCGEHVRMMLTGQVFSLLSGAATKDQENAVIHAVDRYLFDADRGGVFLNTDFKEVKMDMGRMFGFAYGTKENGAVFSHMAVMYAYALYCCGHAKEGWKVLKALYLQSTSFPVSRILPGIPEYFDLTGRGMYPYLTGAASWFLLTMRTQVFGVHGEEGNLVIEPKLTAEQFNKTKETEMQCRFRGRKLKIRYRNPGMLEWGSYCLKEAEINGKKIPCENGRIFIPSADFDASAEETYRVTVELEEIKDKE